MKLQELRTDSDIKRRIEQILDLLRGKHGVPEWQPRYDPISVLVQTILSQNTSDVNSKDAFQSLLASFHKWEDVIDCNVDTIALHIRRSGLGRIKAQRITQALIEIEQRQGRLELDFLKQLTLTDAEDWLCKLPGVGLKTARCVLLFSLGMPALPVDTHIWRVTKRLGLVSQRASLREAHYALRKVVLPTYVYQFHILVIEHGRRICQARHPKCRGCILKHLCMKYITRFSYDDSTRQTD